MNKIFKWTVFIAVFVLAVFFILVVILQFYPRNKNYFGGQTYNELKLATSTMDLSASPKVATTSENAIKIIKPPGRTPTAGQAKPKPISYAAPPVVVKEVSPKSFEELINSSIIQLYCGYFNNENATFSNISRGTGVIINEKGEILTNRHIIYDENMKKARPDCFVLKSPFPNEKSQNPKIYYAAEIISYPAIEKFSDSFSKDRYYNDFAILKIFGRTENNFKINLLLGFNYASPDDYSVLENSSGTFNFLPFDWNYQPKDGDTLITLGYGVDASHSANKITSTIGKLSGNIDINGSLKPQILLIESNATTGFSGGALINPQSKGLVGLISWITSGDEAGKYTVAIFRDFLKTMLLQDLNFELK